MSLINRVDLHILLGCVIFYQQLISFVLCVATGLLAFTLVPKSPHDTNRLFGGLVPWKGWLSEREADVFVARIVRADPNKGQASTMSIGFKDMYVPAFLARVSLRL